MNICRMNKIALAFLLCTCIMKLLLKTINHLKVMWIIDEKIYHTTVNETAGRMILENGVLAQAG